MFSHRGNIESGVRVYLSLYREDAQQRRIPAVEYASRELSICVTRARSSEFEAREDYDYRILRMSWDRMCQYAPLSRMYVYLSNTRK